MHFGPNMQEQFENLQNIAHNTLISNNYFMDVDEIPSLQSVACSVLKCLKFQPNYTLPEIQYVQQYIINNISQLSSSIMLNMLQKQAIASINSDLLIQILGELRKYYLIKLFQSLLILHIKQGQNILLPNFTFLLPTLNKKIQYLVYVKKQTDLFSQIYNDKQIVKQVNELSNIISSCNLTEIQPIFELQQIDQKLEHIINIYINQPIYNLKNNILKHEDKVFETAFDIKINVIKQIVQKTQINQYIPLAAGQLQKQFDGLQNMINKTILKIQFNEEQQNLYDMIMNDQRLLNILQFDQEEVKMFSNLSILSYQCNHMFMKFNQVFKQFKYIQVQQIMFKKFSLMQNNVPSKHIIKIAHQQSSVEKQLSFSFYKLNIFLQSIYNYINIGFSQMEKNSIFKLNNFNFQVIFQLLSTANQLHQLCEIYVNNSEQITDMQQSHLIQLIKFKFNEINAFQKNISRIIIN